MDGIELLTVVRFQRRRERFEMMNTPLLLTQMIERAERYFPDKEVVSRTDGGIRRITYGRIGERTRRLSSAIKKLGIQKGDRVGTLAWNHHRHLETYFAVPCSGAVLHTINFRLSPEHIVYIINHAEDRLLFIDADILPLIEAVKDQLPKVEGFIVMTDQPDLPPTSLTPVYHYEQLLAEGNPEGMFAEDLDEHDPAGMCYTSATTGNPKGVIYSHRGILLHSMGLGLADSAGLCERDTALPVVPMFHVNAWGIPFAAVWFGTKLVLPGPAFTPALIAELIEAEKVTIAAGVPTIWLGFLQELEKKKYELGSLRAILCGGSAAPKSMIELFEKRHGIPFIHAYGMTETSPLVFVANLKSSQESLSDDEKYERKARQGLVVPCIEIKIIGQNGEIKRDGSEMGELLIRGPWIADEYYKDERTEQAFQDGWLHTGDVVTMDADGSVKIVDRTKDLIKSGGEWISSVDLENALMAHEAVFEAAVVAVPHEKWQERPIACVVLKDEWKDRVTKQELLDFLAPRFAKWWLPDDILFLGQIPKTGVGKFLKRALREQVQAVYNR